MARPSFFCGHDDACVCDDNIVALWTRLHFAGKCIACRGRGTFTAEEECYACLGTGRTEDVPAEFTAFHLNRWQL